MIDMPREEFRRVAHRAVDLLADYLASLPDGPCRRPVPGDVKHALMEQPVPEHGTPADALLELVESMILPYPMGNGSPRFFGWINSPPNPMSIVGEFLAAGMNPSVAGGDHAATYLEHGVLAWIRQILGYPATSHGILASGGSAANLIGLAVMRHVKTGQTDRVSGLQQVDTPRTVYASTEAHSCIQKAIELLGIGSAQLRRVPVTSDWRLDVQALQAAIDRDWAAGHLPACVVATAGTVNTGAIDPMDSIADICRSENLWFHVDASYGGPGMLIAELAPLYRGLERADSVAMDPHKWLYVPVECGCAFARDGAMMRDTFSLVPAYLRDDTALPWFSEFGIQQSRGFRALKLWLALKHAGLDGYRDSIRRDLALTRLLRMRLSEADDFDVVDAGPLSVTCFRYAPPDLKSTEEVDRLNKRILDAVQRDGEIFLTSTELGSRFVLRASIVNFRTTEEDVETLISVIRRTGRRLRDQPAT